MQRIFRLYKGNQLLATLREQRIDFPWRFCSFEPTKRFAPYKGLFDEWDRLSSEEAENDIDHDHRLRRIQAMIDRWRLVIKEVYTPATFVPGRTYTRPITDVVINITGDRCAWRC